MERLYAPWRMEYIKTGELDRAGCFICNKLNAPLEKDRDNLLLYRGSYTVTMLNLYPYTNGHAMVAPIRHIANYEELSVEEVLESKKITDMLIIIMKKTMSAQGFNVGYNLGRVAGAGCDTHIHLHIVPRWNGDTNFMAIFSETKVISEGLEKTYDNLKNEIEKYVNDHF